MTFKNRGNNSHDIWYRGTKEGEEEALGIHAMQRSGTIKAHFTVNFFISNVRCRVVLLSQMLGTSGGTSARLGIPAKGETS